MHRLGAALKWLVLLPVFAIVVLLAVANDQTVTVSLNPFDSTDTVLSMDIPLYQLGFGLFAVGVLCGGFVMWNSQRKYRKKAKQKGYDAAKWQNRAERAERAASSGQTMIAAPGKNTG